MRYGLDVGGTKTDAVAIAPDGTVVARVRRPTGWGADAVVAAIGDSVRELEGICGVSPTSIGVGIPGQIQHGTSVVTHAVNLGVDVLDIAAAVAPQFGVPVRAENDVKSAALGASTLRGGEGMVAFLNLGTGVAAGFVLGGRIWRGAGGSAGEVGHISVDPAGPLCRCGQRGCIEALAGGGAMAERWTTDAPLPVLDLFDAADAGDSDATLIRAGFAYGVASAVRVLVLTADVDVVVVGGGISSLGARMLAPVVAELDAGAAASPFLRSLRLAERIQLLPPGSPAGALGAALIGAAGATDPAEEALAHG